MCKKMWLCRAIAKTDLTASCPSSIMPIGHHAHWPTCPLVNMPIGHHAHRQSYLSAMPIKHVAYIIMPIEYCAYQPLYQMTIMPYQQSCLCSFKPFGLSVVKATLESQMSVRPSVCLSICHRNPSASQNFSYLPSGLLTIEPINHRAY